MKGLRGNLRDNHDHKNADENKAGERVAEVHRHRNSIATGLPECGRKYLDEPEDESDFWNLASLQVLIHAGIPCLKRRRRPEWHSTAPESIASRSICGG
jgi:hypothetical protein